MGDLAKGHDPNHEDWLGYVRTGLLSAYSQMMDDMEVRRLGQDVTKQKIISVVDRRIAGITPNQLVGTSY